MRKGFNRVKQYEEILRNLNRRGISYSLNFVFGSDTEDEDVFDTTLRFLDEQKAETAYFNILVPLARHAALRPLQGRGPPPRRREHGEMAGTLGATSGPCATAPRSWSAA